jgi:hypothetical protein
MPDEKDRLGDKLHKKEKAEEDRYFDELSKRQLERLRKTHAAATATPDCPRCGTPLVILQHNGVAADGCPKGHGVWFDMSELDLVTKREGEGWLSRLLYGRK